MNHNSNMKNNSNFYISNNNLNNDKNEDNSQLILKNALYILFGLFVILFGSFMIMAFQKRGSEFIFDFEIIPIGYEFDEPFNSRKFEYNLIVDANEVQIDCSTKLGVKGCNTIVAINDKKVDHEIQYMYSDTEIYTYMIHITKKETTNFIKINSIKNNQGHIVIDAHSTINRKLEYSFDNGFTWQSSNKYEVYDNGSIQLLIRDDSGNQTQSIIINVNDIDVIAPTVDIIVKEKGKSKIVLYALASDNYSGVDSYNWNDSGYGSSDTFEVTQAGTYTVSVRDKYGNESIKKMITITQDDFVIMKDENNNTEPSNPNRTKKTYTVNLEANGSDISSTSLQCDTFELNCKVKLPTIIRKNGIVIGWSENKNATKAQYKSGEKITITENKRLYAITSKKLTAKFYKNGATSIGSTLANCTIYNTNTTCNIVTPTITMKNGVVLGWSKNKKAADATYKTTSTIAISSNINLYAITKQNSSSGSSTTLTVILDKNGATNVGKTSLSCTSKNGNACNISLPAITREVWNILGWSENRNDQVAKYKVGEKISISESKTLYAITSKVLTANFNGNGASLSSNTVSCNIYNASDACEIITPTIIRNGWTIVGFSTTSNATTASIPPNAKIKLEISKNYTYYAITNKTFTISYHANGGINAPGTQTKLSGTNINISNSIPMKIGYRFLGWGTSQNGGVQYKSGDVYSSDSNVTLYAKWQDLYADTNYYSYNNTTSSNKFLFSKTTKSGIYNYAPSAITDDNGLIHIFYVGNRDSNSIVDYIYHRTIKKNGSSGYYYSNENVVLEHSQGKWDSVQVCDPTVIKGNFRYNGNSYRYLMVYLGVATMNNSYNQIGLAVSNDLNSSFIKVTVDAPFIHYPQNSLWGVGQPTAINLDGNGQVLISYTQGLNNETSQWVGIYDLSNLNHPQTIKTAKKISTVGSLSYISNAELAIDLVNNKVYCTAHQGNTYATNGVTGTVNYVPSNSMIMFKKINLSNSSSLTEAIYSALTTSTNSWSSISLSNPNYLIHNTGFIRDSYGYVNGISNILNATLISTAQRNGNQNDQLWSYTIQFY